MIGSAIKRKERKDIFLAKLRIKLDKTKWLIKVPRGRKIKKKLKAIFKGFQCISQLRIEKCLINEDVNFKTLNI